MVRPFHPFMRDQLLRGKKWTTMRNEAWPIGEIIPVGEKCFRVVANTRHTQNYVANNMYLCEGFVSPQAFREWYVKHIARGHWAGDKVKWVNYLEIVEDKEDATIAREGESAQEDAGGVVGPAVEPGGRGECHDGTSPVRRVRGEGPDRSQAQGDARRQNRDRATRHQILERTPASRAGYTNLSAPELAIDGGRRARAAASVAERKRAIQQNL